MKHTPMPPALVARVAEQFKALAEPLRLRLMNALFFGERSVGELATATGAGVANASKHLAMLHQAGWVLRRKDGNTVYYALADERTATLCELMCDRVRERAAAEGELAQVAPPPAPVPARPTRRRRG